MWKVGVSALAAMCATIAIGFASSDKGSVSLPGVPADQSVVAEIRATFAKNACEANGVPCKSMSSLPCDKNPVGGQCIIPTAACIEGSQCLACESINNSCKGAVVPSCTEKTSYCCKVDCECTNIATGCVCKNQGTPRWTGSGFDCSMP